MAKREKTIEPPQFDYKLDCDFCDATSTSEYMEYRDFFAYTSAKTGKRHGRCRKHLAHKPA